jgi:hypothetical protein
MKKVIIYLTIGLIYKIMINKKLLLLIFGIVVNFHSYSQWTDITASIGGGISSTTNMSKPYIFDLNNDNYPDFLAPVLSSVTSPYTKYWRLYKNNGNSTFNDVTSSFGLPTNLTSTLGFIDFNGDGFKDLYFYSATGLQIFKNNNGISFTDVSTQLGISSAFFTSGEITSYPLRVFDYDLDGDEDLLYTRTVSGVNTLTAIVNNGSSFSTKVNILNSIPGGGMNFSLFDMDNDGDFDIVFDAYSSTSQYSNGIITLYRKDATGYTNTTSASGLANGLPGEISTIDINQDGNLDIVKGGADCCTSPLYRVFIGNGAGVFSEQTSTYAISNGGYKSSPTIVDFDNDADFDFSWSSYTSTGTAPFRLYVNNGLNTFAESASTYGLNLGVTSGGVPIDDNGNGVWMDLDKDGDLDIVLNREGWGSTSTTGNVWVKRNPSQGNYINIKLNGCGVNKSGIGAKVKLVVGTNTKYLYYGNSPDGNPTNGTDTFHFGLGSATLINSITVYWPNNTTTVLNNVKGNQFLTIGGGAGGSSAPTGSTSQTFCSASTVANLTATGTNLQWYDVATGGTALVSTTALVTGTTYYASQTIGTCESTRTAVGVSINDPQITASATTVCSGTVIQLEASNFISNNLATNVVLENPVLSGLTQSNYTSGATIINFYSWTYGLPGMLVYGDANQKYSSLEANIFVNKAVNAECSTGLAVGVKPNTYKDSYQYNGPGCYYLSMKNGRLSLLDGTANTPSGYWPNELMGVDIPEINFSLALNYKLKIEIKPNAHIYCYLNDVLRMDYTIISGIVSSGKMALITANSSYTFSGIKSSFIPSSFQWSTGETTATINPSPTTTTTYWCDVTTNGVTCRKNVTTTVTPKTTPTFSPVATVCSGATITALPTTSLNGIPGTWSPALNNLATTTYTFIPAVGQCANNASLTIIVNSKTPAPIGSASQTLCSGSTVANITTTGTNIQWYAASTGGKAFASTTTLVNGTTYYASQMVNGCESSTRLAVIVSLNNPTVSASATTVCSGQPTTLTASSGASTTSDFSVGSIGPSGGYIFYDQGSVINGWRYLEVAPVDYGTPLEWGCDGTNIAGTSIAIGTGQTNTNLIIRNCSSINIAARACDTAVINGFGDWYLPSRGDFNLIYQNLNPLGVGNFINSNGNQWNRYWTSSQIGAFAYAQDFTPYYQQITQKVNQNKVRPIRQFATGTPFTSYKWTSGATTASINVNPTTTTQYWVDVTTNGVTCRKFITITVNLTTTAPTGSTTQTLCSGSTVANLTATGTNIKWYSTSTGGTALASSTALVNGTTYYASQTVSACESTTRLAVTVTLNNPTVSATATTVCSGQPTTLTATSGASTTSNFSVGSIGPSGGYVFYDQGSVINGWRYLEASPIDNGSDSGTGCYCVSIPNTSTAIGTGRTNTTNWTNAGCNGGFIATATTYNINGITNWFIPSKDELNLMYSTLKLNNLGNFQNVPYWTSSPASYGSCGINGGAWVQNFTNGTQYSDYRPGYQGAGNLRLVRQFSSETPFSSYLWSTGATTPSISVSPTQTTQYSVAVTTNGVTCVKNITITVGSATPAPTGANNQTMTQGSTLANLVVTGQNIQWYSTPFGGTPLPANTPLVSGVTYYASQTINGCESQFRLPVIVQVTLSNNEFDTIKIVYNPNPVIDILYIKASIELKNAKICNLLGQTIFQQRFNSNEIQLNMSDFPTGTYFVLVESDDINETFKIVKK